MEDIFFQVPCGPIDTDLMKALTVIIQDDQPWTRIYAFEGKLVPSEVLLKDEFYNWLFEQFEYDAGIMKIDSYTCYKWHVDAVASFDNHGRAPNPAERLSTVNVLLYPSKGLCLFGTEDNGITCKVQELVYQPRMRYLFNTAVSHEVINLEGSRYILTLQFREWIDYGTLLEAVIQRWA